MPDQAAAAEPILGVLSTNRVEGVGLLTFVYARDPEGNVIELQSWRIGPA